MSYFGHMFAAILHFTSRELSRLRLHPTMENGPRKHQRGFRFSRSTLPASRRLALYNPTRNIVSATPPLSCWATPPKTEQNVHQ